MSDNKSNHFDARNAVFPTHMDIISKIENSRRKPQINQTLYHYTCIDAFMSIMKNRDFWISNMRFMNDSQEFVNGRDIFIKVIQERLRNENEKVKSFLLKLQDVCKSDISSGIFKINSKDIFSLSFCSNGDILTQWQFYGEEGVSIGFYNDVCNVNIITFMDENQYDKKIQGKDPKTMLHHDAITCLPYPVIYNDDEKMRILNQILDLGISFIKKFNGVEDMCVDELSYVLFFYFALMKDEHFFHEQELRFLDFTPQKNSSVHFRPKGKIILPYIKKKILDANCRPHAIFPISEIVIAPGSQQDYVANSIKYFLNKSGYEYLVEKVRLSKIPYRT